MSAPGGRQVLLDTSVVVAPPLAGLASIADFVAVSAITIAELEHGSVPRPARSSGTA
jgi:predicted nucleic acid-binding protein